MVPAGSSKLSYLQPQGEGSQQKPCPHPSQPPSPASPTRSLLPHELGMLGVHHTDGLRQVPEDGRVAEVQSWGHVVLQDPGELAAHPGKELSEVLMAYLPSLPCPHPQEAGQSPWGWGGGTAPLGRTTGKQARTGFPSGRTEARGRGEGQGWGWVGAGNRGQVVRRHPPGPGSGLGPPLAPTRG